MRRPVTVVQVSPWAYAGGSLLGFLLRLIVWVAAAVILAVPALMWLCWIAVSGWQSRHRPKHREGRRGRDEDVNLDELFPSEGRW